MVTFSITAADLSQIRSVLQRYDPRCDMPREEFEWRQTRADTMDKRMPQVVEDLDVLLRRLRPHFVDDPDTLKKWEEYEKDVRYAFTHSLRGTLISPVCIPVSDLRPTYSLLLLHVLAII